MTDTEPSGRDANRVQDCQRCGEKAYRFKSKWCHVYPSGKKHEPVIDLMAALEASLKRSKEN